MKSFGAVILSTALLFSCTVLVRADDATKNAKIEEMMQLSQAERMLKATLDQLKGIMASQTSKMDIPSDVKGRQDEIQKKMLALVSERMSFEKLKPMFVKLYAETFTEEEIDGILAFYKSPSGKAMIEKTPQLMGRMMPMMQQMMSDLQPEMQKIISEAQK
jgi:hypothetical protein